MPKTILKTPESYRGVPKKQQQRNLLIFEKLHRAITQNFVYYTVSQKNRTTAINMT